MVSAHQRFKALLTSSAILLAWKKPGIAHVCTGAEQLRTQPAHQLVVRLSPGNLQNPRWWQGLQQVGEHRGPVLPLQLIPPGKHSQNNFWFPD